MANNKPYHEKQAKQLCALHALNNLFQDANAFTQRDLDAICQTLAPDNFINPHKSSLGLGNYDVNVIMTAVQQKGCEAIWFDKRKHPDTLVLNNIKGFILNIPNPSYKSGLFHMPPLSFLVSKKHWISAINFQGTYFNLDSKLNEPQRIGTENDLVEFLNAKNLAEDCELLVIVESTIAEAQSWRKNTNSWLKWNAFVSLVTDKIYYFYDCIVQLKKLKTSINIGPYNPA